MDFKRVEWIFFLAFLGLNIFLFSIYRDARSEQDVVFRSNQRVPIEQRLSSENIQVNNELTKERLEGYYLSGEPADMKNLLDEARAQSNNPDLLKEGTTIEGGTLMHQVSKQVYISDSDRMDETLQNYFNQEDSVLFGQEYVYVSEWSSIDGEFPEAVAAQTYEGIPINDPSGRLNLSLERHEDLLEVDSYTQTYISNLIPLREGMSLYSEEEIINTLYINNKIPSSSIIRWQQLAYTLTLRVRGKSVYVPAWYVAIEMPDGSVQIERVNALTNRIITNNTVRTVENQ
jgi:regulatory protein YycI of two-component signal transduction system YycFG